MSFVGDYLADTIAIAEGIDREAIEALVDLLATQRDNEQRVFILGLGGSLTNACHLAADLRMRAGVRAESPDSLAELTAWANDYGWSQMFARWLEQRDMNQDDALLLLSVGGGGDPDPQTSVPLILAANHAMAMDAPVALIVGEPGGVCADIADVVVKIPTVHPERKTEHVEGWQVVLGHLIVGHPRLKRGA